MVIDNKTIIDIINGTTNTLESNITVNGTIIQLCYNPLNKYIYATEEEPGNIGVLFKILLINTTTNKVDSVIQLPIIGNYANILFNIIYDSYNKYIYTSSLRNNIIYVLNASSNKIIANISLNYPISFDYSSNYVYVFRGYSISVINSNTNNISNNFYLIIYPKGWHLILIIIVYMLLRTI
jgi:YVTN family beta-propeller protein